MNTVNTWTERRAQQPQPPVAEVRQVPPIRLLMADGKWLVPKDQRPKLAPPPVEGKPEQPMTTIRGRSGK